VHGNDFYNRSSASHFLADKIVMFDTKQFSSAIKQIAEERGIPEKTIMEAIEAALAAAYKRDYGKKGQIIRVKLDIENNQLMVTQSHYVVEGVDEEGYIVGSLPHKALEEHAEAGEVMRERINMIPGEDEEDREIKIKFNPEKHILLEDALKIKKNAKIGDEIMESLESKTDFGRIAAQTAKQVIIQELREAEREAIFSEFKGRENEIVSGAVQRREGPLVFVDVGKTNAILPPTEQIFSDNYRIGQRLRFMILRVDDSSRGPMIVLSRASPKLVLGLFKMEVPEIDSGAVEIKTIAREAGSRTKIAVASTEDGVDPIGSLVGQKGVRVQTVINELSGEKIDIILWSEKEKEFIANALSPSKVLNVELIDENRKHALVEVSDDQFSLAIGKKGQNVRLAAKLTGWKIDVRSPRENLSFTEAEPEAAKETKTEEGSTTVVETTAGDTAKEADTAGDNSSSQ